MSIFAYNIVTSQFMFQFCFLLGDQNKKNKCSIVLINLNFTVQAVIEFIPITCKVWPCYALWLCVAIWPPRLCFPLLGCFEPWWISRCDDMGLGLGALLKSGGSRSALLNLVLSFSFRTMPKKHDKLLCLFLTWCKSNGVFTFKPLLFLFWFNSDTAEMYGYLLFWCNSGVLQCFTACVIQLLTLLCIEEFLQNISIYVSWLWILCGYFLSMNGPCTLNRLCHC